jgi:uncharacterized membrane protein
MNLIPDPLHPAIVHFPIVLVLLGAGAAILAAFWRGGHLPRYAALLLALGAVGTWVAVETGESSGGLLESASPQLESLVDAHETWAKRTFVITIVAAVAAAASAVMARWPRLARAVAAVAAIASAAAAYGIYETGHRGGAMVYRHAAGVELAANALPATGPAATISTGSPQIRPESKDRDND